MPLLYAVRCRFAGDREAERAWNQWYAEHLEVLMSVDGFLAGQRFFTSTSPDQRPYLALYEVRDQEVFTSPQYLGVWGFSSWRRQIDNWSRDLFEAAAGGDLEFATPPGEARLRAAFLASGPEPIMDALRRLCAGRSGARSATILGLDRSCSAIAWQAGGKNVEQEFPCPPGWDVVQCLYEPITPCLTGAS